MADKSNSQDNRALMRATPEWMQEKYNQFNQELFGGELGECRFEIFTTGRGSQGGVLGWFCVDNKNVKADRYSRRMFVNDYSDYGGNRRYIDKENFAKICWPVIKLNGHYSGTEESLSETLVHEMCHYYDYMYGTCPKQGHGPSFRSIASWVSSNSGGRFTVQRIASAEVMRGYELDDEMKEKKARRIDNTKARMKAIVVFRKDGTAKLTITSVNDTAVYDTIISSYGRNHMADFIIVSKDPELIELLFNQGYRKVMRTFRQWDVTSKPWVSDLLKDKYDSTIVYSSMKNESKNKLKQIVESVVKEYVKGLESGDGEGIPVAGINLGLESPLELV